MSKVMDRIMDLQAVDWTTVSATTIDQWEQEALFHDIRCRCEKCAVFFARRPGMEGCQIPGRAIAREVIAGLRKILARMGRL